MQWKSVVWSGAILGGIGLVYGSPVFLASCSTESQSSENEDVVASAETKRPAQFELKVKSEEASEAPTASSSAGQLLGQPQGNPDAGEGGLGPSARQTSGLEGGGASPNVFRMQGLGRLGTKGGGSGMSGYGAGGGTFGAKGMRSRSSGFGMNPRQYNAVGRSHFVDHGVNEMTLTSKDALSTFAADVDTASYTFVRRQIQQGYSPAQAMVRVEEFVNYFPYERPDPKPGQVFAVQAEAAPSPWTPNRTILKVGVNTKVPDLTNRKPMALTFLVDTSCSMTSSDKMGFVKHSLQTLLSNLGPEDTVAMATYAGSSRIVLPPTSALKRTVISNAVDDLSTGGSTAMGAGIDLAYGLADTAYRRGIENRVIILSDGDANVGATTHKALLSNIAQYAGKGVTLSTIGYGQGNYQDHLMEQLANKGDGNSFYIDSLRESERVFGENILGNLQTVARDVKFQIEFNPDVVHAYRLIGYENRDIADADFRKDEVDAGEVGLGHSVTALYELVMDAAPHGELATVRLRHKKPGKDVPAKEHSYSIPQGVVHEEWSATSKDYRIALGAVSFAEKLRGSRHVEELKYSNIADMIRDAQRSGRDEDRELLHLVERVRDNLSSLNVPYNEEAGALPQGTARAAMGTPAVIGSHDRKGIQRVISRHMSAIRYCYQRELTKVPTLAGTMSVRFVINEDGTVSSAKRQQSTLGNEAVDRCVIARVKRMKFDGAVSQGVAIVTYPFRFSVG